MPRKRSILALVILLALLCPTRALAGSAGADSIMCQATEQLRYVEDTNGNGVRDSGENTDCTNPVFDETSQLILNGPGGTACLPAVDAELRGTLTVIADDDARDNDSNNTGVTVTVMIEVRHQDQIFRVAEGFTAAQLDDLTLGNWDNGWLSEANAFSVQFSGALFLRPPSATTGAFDSLGAELSTIAQGLGLIGTAANYMPIVSDASRDAARKRFVQSSPTGCGDAAFSVAPGCGELETEATGGDPLASIAVYRLTLGFAEKATSSHPNCS